MKPLIPVGRLLPGTRFYEPKCGITGVLIHANECRAHVKLESGTKLVDLGDRSFIAQMGKETDWTPEVPVTVHENQEEVNTMAKKKAKSAKKIASTKCLCGCDQNAKPGRKFLQGHDARFHGRARKLADGRLELVDLTKELGAKGKYALNSYKEEARHLPKTPPVGRKKVVKAAKKKATKK